jgi:Uma2 family endonuclease
VAGLRSRVTESRYRLPDISVLLSPPTAGYLVDAAYLVIEVLSESDEMSAVLEKLKEYATTRAPNIWLFDPRLRTMSSTARRRSSRSKAIRSGPRMGQTR